MLESIAITGLGLICALGRKRETVLEALLGRRSGVRPVEFPGFSAPIWFGKVPFPETPEEPADALAAPSADPALAFALAAARDALAEARLRSADLEPSRAAVIVSSSKGLIGNLLAAQHNPATFPLFPGDTVSRTLARTLGFSGPALNYPAACATGIASLIPALSLLRDRVADVVLVGSTEASGNSLILSGFSNMGALDPNPSRPFHRNRHGFNPGEGAAVLVLERWASAARRGVAPLALIRGWDLRADASSPTGVEPDGATLEYALRRTLNRAAWEPGHVEYINAHGTGTQLNDAVEAAVIRRVFGPPEGPAPYVSSLKPYVGHLLGASAGVEMALIVQATAAGYLPPTLRLDEPDSALELRHVPEEGRYGPVRRIVKLSLGFGGHIGAVALEVVGEETGNHTGFKILTRNPGQ